MNNNRININKKYYEKNSDLIKLNKKILYLENRLNKKFHCEICDFSAGVLNDLKKHLNSKIHNKNLDL